MEIDTVVFNYSESDGFHYFIDSSITVAVPKGKAEWFKEVIREEVNTLRNQNHAYRQTAKALRERAGDFKSLNAHSSLITDRNRNLMLDAFDLERKIVSIEIEDVVKQAIEKYSLTQYQSCLHVFDVNVDNLDSPDEDIFY